MAVWVALIFGACIGALLSFSILFLELIKKENKKTQEINNKIQYTLDNMTPRDFYIHKISQNNLVWDHNTDTHTKMEQK